MDSIKLVVFIALAGLISLEVSAIKCNVGKSCQKDKDVSRTLAHSHI